MGIAYHHGTFAVQQFANDLVLLLLFKAAHPAASVVIAQGQLTGGAVAQFQRLAGLHQKVVGPEQQRALLITLGLPGRQHEDRKMGGAVALAQQLQHLEPGGLGHHQVEDQQGGYAAVDQ